MLTVSIAALKVLLKKLAPATLRTKVLDDKESKNVFVNIDGKSHAVLIDLSHTTSFDLPELNISASCVSGPTVGSRLLVERSTSSASSQTAASTRIRPSSSALAAVWLSVPARLEEEAILIVTKKLKDMYEGCRGPFKHVTTCRGWELCYEWKDFRESPRKQFTWTHPDKQTTFTSGTKLIEYFNTRQRVNGSASSSAINHITPRTTYGQVDCSTFEVDCSTFEVVRRHDRRLRTVRGRPRG